MSADTLRRAAALMRERAEAARVGIWFSEGVEVAARWDSPRGVALAYGSDVPQGNVANAEHIASWHPAVALAVAAWLEQQAEVDDVARAHGGRGIADNESPMVVARTYLGELS